MLHILDTSRNELDWNEEMDLTRCGVKAGASAGHATRLAAKTLSISLYPFDTTGTPKRVFRFNG